MPDRRDVVLRNRLKLPMVAFVLALVALCTAVSGGTAEASESACEAPGPFNLEIGPSALRSVESRQGGSCTIDVSISRTQALAGTLMYQAVDGQLVPLPEGSTATPSGARCSVQVHPRLGENGSLSVDVMNTGDCSGFVFEARISLSGASAPMAGDGGATASATGSRRIQGELEAKDVIGVVMVEQRMNMGWSYSGSAVSQGSKRRLNPNYNAFWYWVGPAITSGPNLISQSHYQAYYYDRHKSDGFPISLLPDTYFAGTITLDGYGNGSGHCTFSWQWTNQYTGTHASHACWWI